MATGMTGRHLPPEWAPQSFVLLAWPHAQGDFGPWLEEVERSYRLIVEAICFRQPAVIVCRNAAHRERIENMLENSAPFPVHFVEADYHDIWVRDTAPLIVLQNGQPLLVDFRFNGWGQKYPWQEDDRLGATLYRQGLFGQVPYERVDWVLEGGSLETDGQGTLLATRSSLLNPNRNPNPEQAEAKLGKFLGLKRYLWLDHGHLEGDDTDGHIDTLARFCDPDTIVYQACDDPDDCHFAPLNQMAKQLAQFTNAAAKPFRLVALPWPRPIHNGNGRRLPASYANFLIINQAVLAPVYDDPSDTAALTILNRCFPDREIIPIPARPLIHQYGSIHCMTMHYPKPTPLEEIQ